MVDDVPEWIEASDGSWLHRTTIQYRENVLGWSRAEARSRPVRLVTREAEESVASRARADQLTPGKIQTFIRLYGVTYEEARDYMVANGIS